VSSRSEWRCGADGRTRSADRLMTNWCQAGSTDVRRRPGPSTVQGLGAARGFTGVHPASGRPPLLLSRLLSTGEGEFGWAGWPEMLV